jgi:uncharacterized damage-inducible protein DinB
MSIAQGLLPEFDHEMTNTRAILARVPEARADWQPHAKSMTLGKLAIHVATLPGWVPVTMHAGELDFANHKQAQFENATQMLQAFDESVKAARAALEQASDADFGAPWTLRNGGHVIFTMPRIAVYRSFTMNHIIHHRGQLSVYLRLLDVPIPGMYGPSADDR